MPGRVSAHFSDGQNQYLHFGQIRESPNSAGGDTLLEASPESAGPAAFSFAAMSNKHANKVTTPPSEANV